MSILAIQTLSILNIKFKAVLKKEKAGEEGEKEEEREWTQLWIQQGWVTYSEGGAEVSGWENY